MKDPTQATFEFYRDWPVRPKQPERLFFSLFPDAETSIRVRQFAEQFICENHLQGTQLKPRHLHLSLHHVGDYKRLRTKFIYAATQAGHAVSMHPFQITLRLIKSFQGAPSSDGKPRNRPLVLLGEGHALLELHRLLGAAMRKNGLRAAEHFMPHMTLFYGPRLIRVQAIEPIRFTVNEFSLVHSKLGLTQYDMIERWSLQG